MINKRLLKIVPSSAKYIAQNVLLQWVGLVATIVAIFSITYFLQSLITTGQITSQLALMLCVVAICIAIRVATTIFSAKAAFLSSKEVKLTLRRLIFEKLSQTGRAYTQSISSSEVVQLMAEGVDQLETYFAAYLPQLFYSLLAPITLFAVFAFIDFKTAIVLLICVPLIPLSIVVVQKVAKKLLSKYWAGYSTLGDNFLESLQGLTTLKVYSSDEFVHNKINAESENFRKITMRVLVMQLNSITVMDIFAFGGAALGIILAINAFSIGSITVASCLAIILLSAEFFIPMRRLGSFFHIAMNGMAAIDKIFRLLDLPQNKNETATATNGDIVFTNVNFGYDDEKLILKSIDAVFRKNTFTAIVGESGCGKSTIAKMIIGENNNYTGNITINGDEINTLTKKSLMETITYIGFNSHIFGGTVRDNLLMANSTSNDDAMWCALAKVNLADFFKAENGLDTVITEKASNISGGQRQRLALARAILADTPIYIFDEATSNIDAESEDLILQQIYALAKTKTVIMISHRLKNITNADNIFALDNGTICEIGKHKTLMENSKKYSQLWQSQLQLEQIGGIAN